MEKIFISSSFSAILTLPRPKAKGENEQDRYIKTKYRMLPFFLYVLKLNTKEIYHLILSTLIKQFSLKLLL